MNNNIFSFFFLFSRDGDLALIETVALQVIGDAVRREDAENTEFYEARVSIKTNEYRTVLFAVDSTSFMESKRVLFLNSFLKKDNKQYKSEVEKARKILSKYIQEDIDND